MTGKPELTHRERVLLALDHRKTDRIPVSMICSGINPPARRDLEEYLRRTRGIDGDTFLRGRLDVVAVAPPYRGPALPPGTDVWGVRRAPVSYGPGAYDEIVEYPLAHASIDDLRRMHWPTPEWYDVSSLAAEARTLRDRDGMCLILGSGNLFETSWYMRGFDRFLEDLALEPEFAHELLDRVTDAKIACFRSALEAAGEFIDLAFTADDIAGQHGLLVSPAMWETFIKPRHVRLNRVLHEFGLKVVYHSDGAVSEAVPGLADMGIDVLQALQFSADGMDAEALKRDFGNRLCFEGGISVQTTLPFGSTEDVRTEVRERIRVLGRSGGYILGPSHAIQAGTPPENIVAMFEEAARYYPFRAGPANPAGVD